MPDYAIVTDELRRLTVRVIPVALVILAAVLLGQPLGDCTGCSGRYPVCALEFLPHGAQRRACSLPDQPGRASKIVTRSYAMRYVLTALFLLAVIWTGRISVPAAVLPLFSPKITLMISHYWKKGGKP
ncbi:MAG: hypothetical protein ACLUB2_06335 [Butyricicoccus pullicaecorum]